MFDKEFYPTPTPVIELMLQDIDVRNKIILEPSAGKGNIVDFLNDYGAKEVLTYEKNIDLQKIVAPKSRLLGADFFDCKSENISHIDMIIMNPPFSNADKHISHAWDIAPDGCQIIALCNSDTLKYGYSKSRLQLLELIQQYGRQESFGECFSDAERTTDVNVSCIYLYKPKTGEDEFADFFSLDEDIDQGIEGVAQYNYVRDIVGRYVSAVQKFDTAMSAANEINSLTAPISNRGIKFGAYQTGEKNFSNTDITRDYYKKELQKQCWHRVFEDMKMDKYVTKGVKENINKFVERQEHVPFTVNNIYKMLEIIVGTHADRMNKVLIEAFELICSFSSENSTAGEKWKTNSDYMVNKKFIVPYILEHDARWSTSYVKLGFGRNREHIEDIVKALSFLTGTNYDDIQPLRAFVNNTTNITGSTYKSNAENGYIPMLWGQWYEWKPLFRVRGYKKGTMHFEFLDEDVWMKFNIAVAKAKGWQLPKSRKPKKQTNKDMQAA